MRRLILAVVAVAVVGTVSGQRIEALRRQLASGWTMVTVREIGTAATTVASYDAQAAPITVDGYRVRIFFDNKQTARAASLAVQSQFDALYPEIPSYWAFESPNFVVTVGNFTTKEDALALKGRIQSTFPKAFVIRQNIPVSAFVSKK